MSDTGYTLTISGLIKKRAEVSGEVAKARAVLDRALADLQAIDRALELVGYTETASDIPRKTRGSKTERDAAQALQAFLRRTLEASPEPMRASVLAKLYRQSHGITSTDSRTAEYYRTKVLNGLRSMARRGETEMVGKGLGARWRLVDGREESPAG